MSALAAAQEVNPLPPYRLGMHTKGVEFILNGEPFRGIGVNHFDLFLSRLLPFGTDTNYLVDIPAIAARGIPFIRFSIGAYDVPTWQSVWFTNRAASLAKLDEIVACAEANNVGLVPCLLWSVQSFCDLVYTQYGTHEGMRNLAYTHTNAWAMFVDFVSTIVTRYKDSPAIWMWGVGNEVMNKTGAEFWPTWAVDGSFTSWLNWGPRPDGGTRSPTEKMDVNQYFQFSRNSRALIHSLDPHRRAVLAGNALGTQMAVGNQISNTLSADTLAMWQGIPQTGGIPWAVYRDKEHDAITTHSYPQSISNGNFFSGDEKTLPELIALFKGWADAHNAAFFQEEFGATWHGDTVDQISRSEAQEIANFNSAVDAIVANDVRLSAVWNYGGNIVNPTSDWATWEMKAPARVYQLDRIQAVNAAMRQI